MGFIYRRYGFTYKLPSYLEILLFCVPCLKTLNFYISCFYVILDFNVMDRKKSFFSVGKIYKDSVPYYTQDIFWFDRNVIV